MHAGEKNEPLREHKYEEAGKLRSWSLKTVRARLAVGQWVMLDDVEAVDELLSFIGGTV